MPDLVQMPLQLAYDKKLEEHFQRIGENPKTFLKSIVNFASFYFMSPDGTKLPSRIEWLLKNDIQIIQDLNITSDEMCDGVKSKIEIMTQKRRGDTVPLMLFAGDNGDVNTIGCAYLSVACGTSWGTSWGITDFQSEWTHGLHVHKIRMARTMAHEFGHMVSI